MTTAMEIIITFMLTAAYFIIGIITAVFKSIQLGSEEKRDKAMTLATLTIKGIFWPIVIILYAARKKERVTLLMLGILFLSGCTDTTPYQDEKVPLNNPRSTALITEGQIIVKGSDGCDYIYWYDIILEIGGLTHSGSCKQCWNRMDSLLRKD